MPGRSWRFKLAVTAIALLAAMLFLPLAGQRCIVIEDGPQGGVAVWEMGVAFLPGGGFEQIPVAAFRDACVYVRTQVTIAGVPYAAGDKLVVDGRGGLIRAGRIQALRMVIGYWTGRLTGRGPNYTSPRRSLN